MLPPGFILRMAAAGQIPANEFTAIAGRHENLESAGSTCAAAGAVPHQTPPPGLEAWVPQQASPAEGGMEDFMLSDMAVGEAGGDGKVYTLQAHLTGLQREDPRRVFIARRIGRMGFRSEEVLMAHYSQYGKVLRVLVAHSKVKPFRTVGNQPRIRPGSLGFVVMESADCVEQILEAGPQQVVAGHPIHVERFKQNYTKDQKSEPEESSQSASVADSTGYTGNGTQGEWPQPAEKIARPTSAASASTSVTPSSSSWQEARGDSSMGDSILRELTQSLKRLAVIANESLQTGGFTGQQCLETAALSRLTQEQLQYLTELCQARIEACQSPAAPPPGAWRPHWMNQSSNVFKPAAPSPSVQAYGEPFNDSMAWTTSALQQAQEILASSHRLGAVNMAHTTPLQAPGLRFQSPAPEAGQPQARNKQAAFTCGVEAQAEGNDNQSTRDMRASKKQTLGMHLTELQGEDPRQVFIARRISRMGFRSQEVLAKHYSQYGKVCRVLVAHSKVKAFQKAGSQPRIRPGSLGFVVMGSIESVQKIFAVGKEQTVAGCHIRIEPFEHTTNKAKSSNGSGSTSAGDTPDSGGGSNDSSKSSQEKASAEENSTDSQLGESSDAGSANDAGEQGSPTEKKAEANTQASAPFAPPVPTTAEA